VGHVQLGHWAEGLGQACGVAIVVTIALWYKLFEQQQNRETDSSRSESHRK